LLKYFGILFFIINAITVAGQSDFKKGFIQLTDQRIVPGYVKSLKGVSSNFTCVFKESEFSEEIQFSPDNLLSFGNDYGEFYASKIIPFGEDSIRVFVRRIIEGRANLFEVLQRLFIEKDTLFLELTNVINNGQETRSYVGTLNFLLDECERILPFLKSIQNSKVPWKDNVTKGIEIFNTCDKPLSKIKSVRLNLSPFMGLNYSRTNFSISNDPSLKFYSSHKYYNQSLLMAGLDLELSVPKISNQISVAFGVWYTSTQIDFSSSSPTEFNEYKNYSKELLIPIGLTWTLNSKKKISEFITARIAKIISLSEDSKRIQELNTAGNIYTYESSFSENRLAPAVILGIGLSYNLSDLKLFFGANYVHRNSNVSFTNSGNQELKRTNNSGLVTLGLTF
jgi:hypothetical protein